MKPIEQREREIKFEVPEDDWSLPGLSDLLPAGGSLARRDAVLDSTYYDSADYGLLRNRLTLRRRTGSEDVGWQLKVPAGDARTELQLPVEGRGVPAQFRQLTLGARLGQPLRAVARVQIHRDVHVVLDAGGTPMAEVVLDAVTATRLGSAAVVSRWNEIEVELKHGDEALLKRIAKRLRKSGAATSDHSSKLARALGDAAPSADLTSEDLTATVRTYLDVQRDAIMVGDLALRREQDAIHATRVATRRYRSVLRVFADHFDPERTAALDGELKWFAGVLGAVRDVQVLGDHLRSALADLPKEYVLGPVSARLEQTLTKDLAAAQRALATAMRGRRYVALLTDLQAWSAEPPLSGASKPARGVEKYLRKAEKKLDRRLAAAYRLPDSGTHKNEALHRARKAAKRTRYIAELSRPVLGNSARAALKAAKALQTELGERQDAVVAVAFLRQLGAVAGTTPGENGFTFGILLANEAHRGQLD